MKKIVIKIIIFVISGVSILLIMSYINDYRHQQIMNEINRDGMEAVRQHLKEDPDALSHLLEPQIKEPAPDISLDPAIVVKESTEAEIIFKKAKSLQVGSIDSEERKEAFILFRKSARMHHLESQCILGSCWQLGVGTEKNEFNAHYWIDKAANAGYAKAQYRLAWFYGMGYHVDKNDHLANIWMKKAAAQGFQKAIDFLAGRQKRER